MVKNFDPNKYSTELRKNHYKRYEFKLRIETDSEIIEFLNDKTINSYIKTLIIEDMKKAK